MSKQTNQNLVHYISCQAVRRVLHILITAMAVCLKALACLGLTGSSLGLSGDVWKPATESFKHTLSEILKIEKLLAPKGTRTMPPPGL